MLLFSTWGWGGREAATCPYLKQNVSVFSCSLDTCKLHNIGKPWIIMAFIFYPLVILSFQITYCSWVLISIISHSSQPIMLFCRMSRWWILCEKRIVPWGERLGCVRKDSQCVLLSLPCKREFLSIFCTGSDWNVSSRWIATYKKALLVCLSKELLPAQNQLWVKLPFG